MNGKYIVNIQQLYIYIISNRYLESALYLLPIRPENLGAVEEFEDEMGLTEDEVAYMVANETLELPRNFFRRFVSKSSLFSTLQYVGFNVRDKFPNNIVRLRDGKIKYVTHFETDYEDHPHTKGEMKPSYLIHGFCFKEV